MNNSIMAYAESIYILFKFYAIALAVAINFAFAGNVASGTRINFNNSTKESRHALWIHVYNIQVARSIIVIGCDRSMMFSFDIAD